MLQNFQSLGKTYQPTVQASHGISVYLHTAGALGTPLNFVLTLKTYLLVPIKIFPRQMSSLPGIIILLRLDLYNYWSTDLSSLEFDLSSLVIESSLVSISSSIMSAVLVGSSSMEMKSHSVGPGFMGVDNSGNILLQAEPGQCTIKSTLTVSSFFSLTFVKNNF